MARWCLLRTSWSCLRGGARWSEATVGGSGPARLRLRCRVCSAKSVWISARSRPDTHWPFSTRISSPGSRPGNTGQARFRKEVGKVTHMPYCHRWFQDYFLSGKAPSLNASPSGSTSLTKILLFLWVSMCPVTAKPGRRKKNKESNKDS